MKNRRTIIALSNYLLDNLLEKNQRHEEALAPWEQSVKLDPGNAYQFYRARAIDLNPLVELSVFRPPRSGF